jgi:cellulose synthase/poly-beta-1,6-N-acetylglucosamine synthase-like glycosyltransferase
MPLENILGRSVELDLGALRRRFFAVLPGALAWTTLVGLSVLAFIVPFWIAVFIIVFDVYVLVRAAYMSIHLVYAYLRLHQMKNIDWVARCRRATGGLPWQQVHHIVVLPTYDESLIVLRTTLRALAAVEYPPERLHVVVGFEERSGPAARERAAKLREEFSTRFGTFLTTFHPDNLPGEKRVKSANANWAVKKAEKRLLERGIPVDHILVSNFDSDTVVSPTYFAYLTYVFINHPDRYRVSYQPLPMYNNNLWDAPAFSRVIATGSTFWQMIESTRPERLVTFSSHSMTLRALKDVGYWQADIISEDSRIFWQCLLRYDGNYRTEPLYTSVSMDAALADSWWRTFKNQYKQKRRWAWGIENFPYLAEGFIRNKRIPRRIKFTYALRTLEGHYSWATTAIIVAGLGWLPIFFGGAQFHTTVLSYSLPFVARTIMSIAMTGLVVSTVLSLLLLPPKPARYSAWRYVSMFLQWILVPVIATILSALPALDAETRLLLGRDLSFNVMQKTRKASV